MLTIHRSKGLEFPIVYCPYLWEPGYIRATGEPVVFHDPDAGDARTIDVGARRPGLPRATSASTSAEQRGEDLRLAYVALTRAQHQAVVWWARLVGQPRLGARPAAVRARRTTATSPPTAPRTPTRRGRDRALRGARRRGARAASASSARRSGLPVRVVAAAGASRPSCPPRASTATLDRRWRRTSYSDITAGALRGARRERAGGAARRRRARRRRAAGRRPATTERRCARRRRCSPTMPAGVAGRHASCTACSRRPTSPPPTSTPSWPRAIAAAQARRPVDVGDPAAVVAGPARRDRDAARAAARRPARCATSRAPTASTSSTSSCRSPAATSRPAGSTLAADRRRAARAPPAGDPLAGYADRLDDPALRQQRARLPDRQHRPRRCRAGDALRRRRLQDELARRRRARS